MNFFVKLWKSRDELSLKNIRGAYVPYMLVFPLAIILSDVLYHDWELEVFGIDSILLQILIYGFAWLLCSILPKNSIPYALRLSVIAGFVLAVPTVILENNGVLGFVFISVFQFCFGVSAACGFYIYSYVLRNAERWMGTAIIGIYYGLSWTFYELGPVKQIVISILPIALSVVFAIIIFFIKPEIMKSAAVISYGKIKNEGDGKTVKHNGFYFVLILYVVYYLINLTNYYLEYEMDYINDIYYGAGMILGVLFLVLIQIIFNKSVWHLWNLYLLLTVVGVVTTGLGIGLGEKAGSLIYGVADNIGYLAVLYLIGSVAKMNGKYKFFRLVCFIMFAHDVILSPIVDKVFELTAEPYNITAITIILVSVAACFLIAPLLNRTIFSMEWIDNLHALDLEVYGEQFEEINEIDRTESLNLTRREKQIFTLLLTELSPKQIAGELNISIGTINFHSANLYRKLEIQSRAELFSKYANGM